MFADLDRTDSKGRDRLVPEPYKRKARNVKA
jgi:hypothetical protein